MADDGWQLLGNTAAVAGLISFFGGAGVVSMYQTYGSPYATLQDCWSKLEEVNNQLQAVSPRRREEIAAACRRDASNGLTPQSLEDLEKIHAILLDGYRRAKNRYESGPIMSHLPFTKFRAFVTLLKVRTSELLKDTTTTTVPFLDELRLDPLPRRAIP